MAIRRLPPDDLYIHVRLGLQFPHSQSIWTTLPDGDSAVREM